MPCSLRAALVHATVLVLCAVVSSPAQTSESKPKSQPKRPSVNVKATPGTGIVPVRITAVAELKGGDDDFEEYYCPTIEWNWGDGTVSESTSDCDPYQAGKSQVRRRHTVSHGYERAGTYRISFRLKNKEKLVGSATTVVRLLGGIY
ncbi:MAG: PKD domain-containing protein [Acidobacteria bacterium]|nr:PKD domain-containing protein [Acidobacteriota bacterium]